jgi:hypothetical protein
MAPEDSTVNEEAVVRMAVRASRSMQTAAGAIGRRSRPVLGGYSDLGFALHIEDARAF